MKTITLEGVEYELVPVTLSSEQKALVNEDRIRILGGHISHLDAYKTLPCYHTLLERNILAVQWRNANEIEKRKIEQSINLANKVIRICLVCDDLYDLKPTEVTNQSLS